MSDEMAAFLRARLDEDEAKARECLPGPWMTGTQAGFSELVGHGCIIWGRSNAVAHGAAVRRDDTWGKVADLEAAWKREAHIAHITTHDPARVLREVEAKRQLLTGLIDYMENDHAPWNEEFIKLLALPYTDHPDYREEWRP